MSTESAQRDKLKRLKEERQKNTLPLQSFSTQSARKYCPGGPLPELKSKPSFLTDKKREIFESKNEVSSSSGETVKNSKPPSPIAVQCSSTNYDEQKRLRNRKRRERMKKKRDEKKRELLDSINSSSVDEIGEKCVDDNQSEDRPVDDEEIKEDEIEPVLETKVTEEIKLDEKPSPCKSELERKLWKNIAEDLEDLEDVSSDSLDCKDQGLTMDEEIKLSKEEEALTVQAMIMDLEDEEPSDWEDREPPLEGELIDCDEPDITIRVRDIREVNDSAGEGQDEQCVVLLSSDDESNTKKKSKTSLAKEILHDRLKTKNVSSLERNKKSEDTEEDTANNTLVLSEDSDNPLQLEASENCNVNNPPTLESPIHLRIEAVATQNNDSDLKNQEDNDEWVEEDWVETEEYQDERADENMEGEASTADVAKMDIDSENELPQETMEDGDAISRDEERYDEFVKINIDGDNESEKINIDGDNECEKIHIDVDDESHKINVDDDDLEEGQTNDELEEEHSEGEELEEEHAEGEELEEKHAEGEEIEEEHVEGEELEEERHVDGDDLEEERADGDDLIKHVDGDELVERQDVVLAEGQADGDEVVEKQADENEVNEGQAAGDELDEGKKDIDELDEGPEDIDKLDEEKVDGDQLVERQVDGDELNERLLDGEELDKVQKYGDEFDNVQKDGEEFDNVQKDGEEFDNVQKDGEEFDNVQKDGEEFDNVQKDGEEFDKVQKDGDEFDKVQKDGEELDKVQKDGDEGQTDSVALEHTKKYDRLDGVEKDQMNFEHVEKNCEKDIEMLDKHQKKGDKAICNKKDSEKFKLVGKDCDKSGPNNKDSDELQKAGENVHKVTENKSNDELVKEDDKETNQLEQNMDVDELVGDDDKLVTTNIEMEQTVETLDLPEEKTKGDPIVESEETKMDTTVNDSLKEGEKLLEGEKSCTGEGEAESEWMENVDWVENDAWTEDQDEELEDGEIKIIEKGQQLFKNKQYVDAEEEKKVSEVDGEKSQDGSSIPSPAVSSLAETEDSQIEISNLDKGKPVEIDSAEAKFDLLFKSTSNNDEISKTNNTELSKSDQVLKVVKDSSSILSQTLKEDLVPDLSESIAAEAGGGELTIDEAPTLTREDVDTAELNSANDKVVEMETNRISKTSEVVMREGSVSEGTDDARLQLDFSSEDETPVGSSSPSTSALVKEVKISESKAENNITNGTNSISEVNDEALLETKDDLKDTSLSRKRGSEEVNLEVFVSEQVPKKAKLDDEEAFKDEKKNFEDQVMADAVDPIDENDEYKDLRIASSPRKLTMHDLESIIRAKIFDYVEECNKAKMDALGQRVDELEKQVERWKKRASYLETQVKEAESEIELYKVQVATNKQNERAAAAAAAVNTSPVKPTPTLSKPSTTTTANTFSRKSTTTPAMNMTSTTTSIAPNRNLGPPPSTLQQSIAKKVDSTPTPTPTKPTTAVPLQLIANTALTNSPPKPKSTITPTKQQPQTGSKPSATIIDLTEEEEDKSATKVASSPNRQVVFKPTTNSNVAKNNNIQSGRSLLQSNATPVSVSLPSGQMVTLPVMPGTSLPSMVQLIPQGSATISSSMGSGVRLSGPNSNIRSSTFSNQTGPQLAYLIQGGTTMANQSGGPNRHQLFTVPAPGGILQNTARPGQMPTFLVMRNPIPSTSRMTTVGTAPGGSSTSINTIPLGGSGLSISMTRPQGSIQSIAPAGASKQRHPIPTINLAMPTGNSVNQRPKPIVPLKHPAPLPPQPQYQPSPTMKILPPRPALKISKVSNGIVLSWNMTVSPTHAEIVSYQLYAYQETNAPPNTALWKKVGDVKALPLPMACTLTQFIEGNRYYFAVRAVDVHTRIGPFSDPTHIVLPSKQTVQKM